MKETKTKSTVGANAKSEGTDSAQPTDSSEERRDCIAKAAYFRAQTRGFLPGCELEDWVQAEAEIVALEQTR